MVGSVTAAVLGEAEEVRRGKMRGSAVKGVSAAAAGEWTKGAATAVATAGVNVGAAAAPRPTLPRPRPRPRPPLPRPPPRPTEENRASTALVAVFEAPEASRLLLRTSMASASRAASAQEKLAGLTEVGARTAVVVVVAAAVVVATPPPAPASSSMSSSVSPAPTRSASSIDRARKVAEAWRARNRRAERARASGLRSKEAAAAARSTAAAGDDEEGSIFLRFFCCCLRSGLGFFELEPVSKPRS